MCDTISVTNWIKLCEISIKIISSCPCNNLGKFPKIQLKTKIMLKFL